MTEVDLATQVDNKLLKELIEVGKKIQKELDEFNEKLDTLIDAVTVEEITPWID